MMIDTAVLKDLLAEYRRDRRRMEFAPLPVRQRYDTITSILEEVIEFRTMGAVTYLDGTKGAGHD